VWQPLRGFGVLGAELAQQCASAGNPAATDLSRARDLAVGQQVMGLAGIAPDDGADLGSAPAELSGRVTQAGKVPLDSGQSRVNIRHAMCLSGTLQAPVANGGPTKDEQSFARASDKSGALVFDLSCEQSNHVNSNGVQLFRRNTRCIQQLIHVVPTNREQWG
jgi:hypothetical protein